MKGVWAGPGYAHRRHRYWRQDKQLVLSHFLHHTDRYVHAANRQTSHLLLLRRETSQLDLFTVGPKFTRRVARHHQQQLSIDICYRRQTSAANSPAAAAVDRLDRQTNGRTDTRPFNDAYCIGLLRGPRTTDCSVPTAALSLTCWRCRSRAARCLKAVWSVPEHLRNHAAPTTNSRQSSAVTTSVDATCIRTKSHLTGAVFLASASVLCRAGKRVFWGLRF